ncbi:MAG TPA: hypothetical protein VKS24_24950 [Bradyrhizobium sp.]|nr:hypothetical protein [Bradyrhizobium sp.]
MAALGNGRWGLIASLLGAGLGLVAAVAGYGALTAQVQGSAQAISEMRSRSAEMEAKLSLQQQQITELTAAQKEIETQFCSSDIVRNLMHANELRIVSMLWNRVFPRSIYPTDNAYYPRVCNRGPQ